MSHSRIEIRHSKKQMQEESRRDTKNGADLYDQPTSEPMRGKHKRIDQYNHSVTTLYVRISRFLSAHVGKPVNAVRSEFIRTQLPGLGASVAKSMRDAFESSIVKVADAQAQWVLTIKFSRKEIFVEDAFGILQKHEVAPIVPKTPKQDLYPVPAKLWANKGFPEAWEKRNGVWHRVSFAYVKGMGFNFGDEWKREPYARTNNNPAFKGFESRTFSCHTCSKKEIKQLILPALKAMGVTV